MSWGTELWDQLDKVTDHTQRGLDFCEKYARFAKDRSSIETEYANKLKRLVKSYTPKRKDDENAFTVVRAFYDMLKEVGDVAGQHDELAENYSSGVHKEIMALISELKSEKKTQMDEAKKLEAQLHSQLRSLEHSKKKYESAFKEQVRAEDMYKGADANINLSRAEVEKAKNISIQRAHTCNDCKASYASVLESTNSHQRDYYFRTLPQILQALQDMDERRVCKLQESIRKLSEIERNIQPIVNTCLDLIKQASDKVDHTEDSRRVVDHYKSGFLPPEDIAFLDLDNEDSKSTNSSNSKASRSDTVTGKSTKANREKKPRGGFSTLFGGGSSRPSEPEKEDFSHLTPQQQKKQLSNKISEIKRLIAKECAEREGMVKMQGVYSQNPSLGDPNSLTQKIDENKVKLDALEEELHKYEMFLANAEGKNTPVMARRSSIGSYQSNHSADISHHVSTPNSHGNIQSYNTPNSNVVAAEARKATPSATSDDSFDDGEADDPLGQATAMYPFDATTEGSVSMYAEEKLAVIELDNGDGWTRVRTSNGSVGFVPTTYIQIHS